MDEINWENFAENLKNDSIFRDYFNKFCCLPIFGQRVSYIASSGIFLFDPRPIRNLEDEISNDHVIEWLLSNRLQLFQRSRAGINFRLCRKLRHDIFERGNGDSPEWGTLEEVKHRHLARVRHVIKFTKFVESTKHDRDLIRFWMEVEEMRSSDTKRLPLLRALVRKYLMKISSHCLPDDVTNQVFTRCRDARGLDYDAIMKLQTRVFQRLHCYWLPQFLMTSTDVTNDEADMLREVV
ncbi:uncharacterized protein LOC144747506 [Ciona intestinalis]